MARCGWCKAPGLDYTDDGMLEAHPMLLTKKMCKGYDNPSLILVRHKSDMEQQRNVPRTDEWDTFKGTRINQERSEKASIKRQRVNIVQRAKGFKNG